jgi:D-alanyl-lipoteichoic acid acyltransferase DltB (MBOAT superfamily)
VVGGYWCLGRKSQNIFLLLASYIFYGWWDYRFLVLMVGSTTLDFFLARAIQKSEAHVLRRGL